MGNLSEILGNDFNAANVETSNGDFQPLPEGLYKAIIESADITPTKKGDGSYLKLQYGVVGPTHAGRKLFHRITLNNPSMKAVEIGREQIASLFKAIGKNLVGDTDELIGRSVVIKVKVDGQYNNVIGTMPDGAVSSVAPSAPVASSNDAAPSASQKGAMPWEK